VGQHRAAVPRLQEGAGDAAERPLPKAVVAIGSSDDEICTRSRASRSGRPSSPSEDAAAISSAVMLCPASEREMSVKRCRAAATSWLSATSTTVTCVARFNSDNAPNAVLRASRVSFPATMTWSRDGVASA